MKENRVAKVLEQMKVDGVSQFIVTDPMAIFYLTGTFLNPGERLFALVLNENKEHKLFINILFPIDDIKGVEKVNFSDTDDSITMLANVLKEGTTIGVDKILPAKFLLPLLEKLPNNKFVNSSLIVDKLRMYKDAEEIDLMRKSSLLNDKVCQMVIDRISPEKSELQVAKEVLEIYDELGFEGVSFDPIIGYGPNGANPHGEPGERYLKPGDSIIVDIGGKKDMYCSDMTRTVFYKEPSEKAREVFEIVLEAQKRGVAAVKPGARFCDIDAACRDYITEKGYGEYFTHRTGHHIGLEDHDYGDVSSANTEVCEVGMIFSIEPGIYLPGEFGVRIEDLVLVTEDGCENLNKLNKELVVID